VDVTIKCLHKENILSLFRASEQDLILTKKKTGIAEEEANMEDDRHFCQMLFLAIEFLFSGSWGTDCFWIEILFGT